MIIDYKNDREFALSNGVSPENGIGETQFSGGELVTDTTFRNFDHLCAEDTVFENCSFESCREITFDGCEIKGCSFKNICNVEGVRSGFNDCVFKECTSQGPFLYIDSRGSVKACTFESITALGDDGYIIRSGYGKKKEVEEIVDCSFTDCRAESEDSELCSCFYFKPLSSFRTVSVNNVDYDSCNFENCTTIDGAYA